MQTLPPPTDKTSVDLLSAALTITVLVLPRIWPLLSKIKVRKTTDTGEIRKVEVLLNMVSESQKEIEELKQENARLTVENYNLHEDYEACSIRATKAENELKVFKGVVEVLRKPPAPPAETPPIKDEGDKEAG